MSLAGAIHREAIRQWVAMLLAILGTCHALAQRAATDEQISAWIEQLSAADYFAREAANEALLRAGEAAVPALERAAQGGDLEVTSRALDLLRTLAVPQRPQAEGAAAAESLQRLAGRVGSSVASRARLLWNDVQAARRDLAYSQLVAAGAFIGEGQFNQRNTRGGLEFHLRLDDRWQGEPSDVSWFSWLYGIEAAVVDGAACRDNVVSGIARMPDLKRLVIRGGKLSNASLVLFAETPKLQQLDLVYVEFADPPVEPLAAIPGLQNLFLYGTNLERADFERIVGMRANCTVEYSLGAFLGVVSDPGAPTCTISDINPNSAAETAGIQPGDTIVAFNEHPIGDFDDLRSRLRNCRPGETIKLRVQRFNPEQPQVKSPIEISVTLGRMNAN
jgi:hypothetical protein